MKSDVYSFGVLVLEIITGKRNRGIYKEELDLNLLRYVSSGEYKHAKTLPNVFRLDTCFSGMDSVERRQGRRFTGRRDGRRLQLQRDAAMRPGRPPVCGSAAQKQAPGVLGRRDAGQPECHGSGPERPQRQHRLEEQHVRHGVVAEPKHGE
jgi:hypothetical protein